MAELTCKQCKKSFTPAKAFTANNGGGRNPVYCGLICRKNERAARKGSRQRARYRELKLLGATSASAQYGADSNRRFKEVKAELEAHHPRSNLPAEAEGPAKAEGTGAHHRGFGDYDSSCRSSGTYLLCRPGRWQ